MFTLVSSDVPGRWKILPTIKISPQNEVSQWNMKRNSVASISVQFYHRVPCPHLNDSVALDSNETINSDIKFLKIKRDDKRAN